MKVLNGFKLIHSLIKMRWVPDILKSIELGNYRYNAILASVPGMSHTELNRKLALLLDQGAVTKVEEGSYALLTFGEELVHIFDHLEELEEKYLKRRG
ncbi:MAG: winged helix-turn-helix transcriptional regulator [Sphaerochaetaceae bacterium]|jgi:DNA-binding HxlR family transcriptional regulator|nr:winged helix-turn-helix transcriptional regulator [Sphaerochaetaceae bacterium]